MAQTHRIRHDPRTLVAPSILGSLTAIHRRRCPLRLTPATPLGLLARKQQPRSMAKHAPSSDRVTPRHLTTNRRPPGRPTATAFGSPDREHAGPPGSPDSSPLPRP